MPSKIRVLSEHTINKIAAGEVIENPASVVKELVENSIDAAANEIVIEIKEGGRELIRVTDNGCGMEKDDAILCFERHATSKIREVEDILAISSMGFRGEAIPSIASISKFTLLTRPKQTHASSSEGTLVIVEGGKILKCGPAPCSFGTAIEVKSLFFNVPVRKKFQKSPSYDANEILKTVSLLSLANPNIKFELKIDQKTVLSTVFASEDLSFLSCLEMQIEAVLGKDFKNFLAPLEYSENQISLKGFIALPTKTMPNKTGQYLFINGRAVTAPLISYAVKTGYGTAMPSQRYPVFVLHLFMPKDSVDVNVHPQKKQVRLYQEFFLKEFVYKAVSKAFQTVSSPMSSFTPQETAIPWEAAACKSWEPADKSFSFSPSFDFPNFKDFPLETPPQQSFLKEEIEPCFPFTEEKIRQTPKVLGTIAGYILLEGSPVEPSKAGLWMIDQQRAHARIIFEQLKKDGFSPALQTLLLPYQFSVSQESAKHLLEHLDMLNSLGIKIHPSGPSAFLVDAIPSIFGNIDLQMFISDMLDEFSHVKDGLAFEKMYEKRLAIGAAKSAVSSKKKLSLQEAESLAKQLFETKTPCLCPQGKSTMTHIGFEELEKKFSK